MNEGFNPRSLALVLAAIGGLFGAWLGTRIDGGTMFISLWSAILMGIGALGGLLLAAKLSKNL